MWDDPVAEPVESLQDSEQMNILSAIIRIIRNMQFQGNLTDILQSSGLDPVCESSLAELISLYINLIEHRKLNWNWQIYYTFI